MQFVRYLSQLSQSEGRHQFSADSFLAGFVVVVLTNHFVTLDSFMTRTLCIRSLRTVRR